MAGFQRNHPVGFGVVAVFPEGAIEAWRQHDQHVCIGEPVLLGYRLQYEIMQWLRGFKRAPKHTYVVHGEPNASDVLRRRISQELGWSMSMPEYRDSVELPAVAQPLPV